MHDNLDDEQEEHVKIEGNNKKKSRSENFDMMKKDSYKNMTKKE